MIYIYKKNLPAQKHLIYSLQTFYGLNNTTAKKVCFELGINPSSRLSGKKAGFSKDLQKYVSGLPLIEDKLKLFLINTQKRLINSKTIRGLRNSKGLPVRGQRTHTNAKTKKRLIQSKTIRGLRNSKGLSVRGKKPNTNAKTKKKLKKN